MSKYTTRVSVALNDDRTLATVRIGTNSTPIVTPCLGVECNDEGAVTTVYVNAKIHRCSKSVEYEGWAMSGAVSTILTKLAA